MFFGNSAESTQKDEGASLSSVLPTPALRVELALLVLLCIDSMRSDLTATFDVAHETPSVAQSATSRSITTSPKPPQDLLDLRESTGNDIPREHVAKGRSQDDMESTQMQALRRSALTFFDKWRAGVMHRICDVLCVRGDTVRQAKARRKQRLEEAARQNQGISSLIDFDEDPFAPAAPRKTRKHGHYNVIETQILVLEEPKRVLILHCLLLLLLSLENYSAHSRVLLLHLASSLELETHLLDQHEKSVAQGLLATAASQMDAEETAKKHASNDAASRRWKVGLAAVGGAVLIGVTGGLAAPLLAAGLGTVMGGLGLGVVSTYLGALASSSVLVGSLFGAYGAKMTGKLMDQYAREVQDFEFLPVKDPDRPSLQRDHEWADEQDARDPAKREQHRLRVTIGVSGWLSSTSDVFKPWEVIDTNSSESFALRFELDAMLRLGITLQDVLFSYAWDGLTYTVVSHTLFGALYAGLWPLGLIKVASVLDNPFSVAIARADKAGKVMAHALIAGVQGKRPVTLIGYSVGARVIFACLVELADQHAFGLVESVVLMGTPAPSDSLQWRKVRSVVAARVVNVYSTEDYVLGYLYRSTKLQMGIAGLKEVGAVQGIENVNVSKLVSGHDKYRYLVGKILVNIGFGDVDFNKIAEQERALELAERKKQRVKEQAKKRSEATSLKDAQPEASPPTIRQNSSEILFDFHTEDSSKKDTPPQQPPQTQTLVYTQGRSGQQPARSLNRSPGNENPVNPQISSDSRRSDSPLPSSTPPTDTVQSSTTKAHGFASAMKPRQKPSALTSLSEVRDHPLNEHAESTHTRKSAADSHSTTAKHSNDNHAKNAAVTVTEVLVVKGNEDPEDEKGASIAHDGFDDDDDEISSEFGELVMVDPVPLDDFDYGLM
ncbi:hypothetical protein FB567DRAFT_545596 [Paraphoma chrysanthemicola]|uniref:DUF726-domain-containing protein n=1 Tax=Paraphoma chrysanthemicola TaxID=798071 RepID=A0A8K0RDU0_9PLEO|nr:hypothetical protein FB567DRAFT_545596 [Paraphoma chrysanthemicola]